MITVTATVPPVTQGHRGLGGRVQGPARLPAVKNPDSDAGAAEPGPGIILGPGVRVMMIMIESACAGGRLGAVLSPGPRRRSRSVRVGRRPTQARRPRPAAAAARPGTRDSVRLSDSESGSAAAASHEWSASLRIAAPGGGAPGTPGTGPSARSNLKSESASDS